MRRRSVTQGLEFEAGEFRRDPIRTIGAADPEPDLRFHAQVREQASGLRRDSDGPLSGRERGEGATSDLERPSDLRAQTGHRFENAALAGSARPE